MIYSNITLPPVLKTVAQRSLVGYFAPIDFDPIHGFDDPLGQPARECGQIFAQWAQVMQSRLVIYDYDQGMLVCARPAESFAPGIPAECAALSPGRHPGRRHRVAGGNGHDYYELVSARPIAVESRRRCRGPAGRLLCAVYGPAAGPMAEYWNAIFAAWQRTVVTEHEYFVAPAIYTPELIETLRTASERRPTPRPPAARRTSKLPSG